MRTQLKTYPRLIMLAFLLAWTTAAVIVTPPGNDWKELSGKHFIVYYTGSNLKAQNILRAAERYYHNIARDLRYRKTDDFWTFEKRCRIYVYPDRDAFLSNQAQAPSWSGGFAQYKERQIVGFLGSDDFLKTVLPHEIAHLILREYIGTEGHLPMWVDEGVALSQEEVRRNKLEEIVWKSFHERKFIPISKLTHMRVTLAKHHQDVQLYYAEAALLIEYLLKFSRKEEFVKFCRNLRDGQHVDQALLKAYGPRLGSSKDLEESFINDLASQFQ